MVVADPVGTDSITMADVGNLQALVDVLATHEGVPAVTTVAGALVGADEVGAEAAVWARAVQAFVDVCKQG